MHPPPVLPDSAGAAAQDIGRRRVAGGGLYDSPERPPPAVISRITPSDPSAERQDRLNGKNMHDPTGDGRGGISGLSDPYDRPTRSQWSGAQSRLRYDKASGALNYVAGRYSVQFGGRQLVHKGLRRSVADAYAAYVGQTVKLPEDSYGLALRALDRTLSTRGLPPGAIDQQNLPYTSPRVTSAVKRAQIFNTAHKIMRDLGGYVYDVSYYCPRELDHLRKLRRPGSAPPHSPLPAAAALEGGARGTGGGGGGERESYRSGPREGPEQPPPQREAVSVALRQPSSTPPPASRRSDRRPLTAPPKPAVSPITGAVRQTVAPPSAVQPDPRQSGSPAVMAPSRQQRPPTTRKAGDVGGTAVVERGSGSGFGPELLDPLEDRSRRDLRRRNSLAAFVKTPPHYRVSKFYDHVTPTQEVLEQMRQRVLRAARERGERVDEEAAAASAAAAPPPRGLDGVVTAAAGGGGDDDGAAARKVAAAMQEAVEAASTAGLGGGGHGGGDEQWRYNDGGGRNGGGRAQAEELDQNPDPKGTEQILWIIETAYELGLAEVLGLEGPPPYPRSERLYPLDHRRHFYNGVYSSPEQYAPYVPFAPPVPWSRAVQHAPPPSAARYGYEGYDGPHAYGGSSTHTTDGGADWPYQYGSRMAYRLEAAAVRRHAEEISPEPEAKLYPRSSRIRP